MERHEDENDYCVGSDRSAVNYHRSSDPAISLGTSPLHTSHARGRQRASFLPVYPERGLPEPFLNTDLTLDILRGMLCGIRTKVLFSLIFSFRRDGQREIGEIKKKDF